MKVICRFKSLTTFTFYLFCNCMEAKKQSKKLFLIRHGKANEFSPNQTDRERPLERAGVIETKNTLQRCTELNEVDLILSSDASRAFETAIIAAQSINYPEIKILVKSKLYLADEYMLLDEIASLSDEYRTVVLVGHNPGLTDLANRFMLRPVSGMPTSSIFGFSLNINTWTNIYDAACAKPTFVVSSTDKNQSFF